MKGRGKDGRFLKGHNGGGKRHKLEGRRFDRVLVLKYAGHMSYGSIGYLCRCDCGKEWVTNGAALVRGQTRSCGCWGTNEQQMNNRRVTSYLTFEGERKPFMEWARESGIDPRTLRGRLRNGWPLKEALSTPPWERPRDHVGEKSPRAILTEENVREIRASKGKYGMAPKLAKKFGVSIHTIHSVHHGNWKHVK